MVARALQICMGTEHAVKSRPSRNTSWSKNTPLDVDAHVLQVHAISARTIL